MVTTDKYLMGNMTNESPQTFITNPPWFCLYTVTYYVDVMSFKSFSLPRAILCHQILDRNWSI